MDSIARRLCRLSAACGFAAALLATAGGAEARGFNVLYHFCAQPPCTDGSWPYAPVIADSQGNLFGTTGAGGVTNCKLYGCGTVFEVAADGTESVLHAFTSNTDGSGPRGGLIMDAKGNLYGTTTVGGGDGCGGAGYGCGTIFKVTPGGKESILYNFAGGTTDGAYTVAGLVADAAGNFYGTASDGGGGTQCNANFGGCGAIFKFATDGTETMLYGFTGGKDGADIEAGLILDKKGNLFGTAASGGHLSNCTLGLSPGCGTVFRLSPDGREKTLYAFKGGNDGWSPIASLVEDKSGNLYGTTQAGGGTACSGLGCGIVFEIAPDGTETILHVFTGGSDGQNPAAGMIIDAKGNLYGTTQGYYYPAGRGARQTQTYGTIFKLAPGGAFRVLYTFADPNNGANPVANLAKGANGVLYGTAEFPHGVVFQVDK
jgi:uncharacterized repeat protein (TIGR03803 family)